MPGIVNAHTHIYSGLAPFGMPAPSPAPAPSNFLQILERVWWPLDRALDAASLRASARFYVAHALLAGTSGLIDHHESPNFIEGSLDVLGDACQELGMRAVVCYGATERNGGREEAQRGLAECERFIRSNDRTLVRGVVGLHASFTVSDETIREAGKMCRELGTVMHVHLAEDAADVADARARGYEGPLERLLAFEALPPGSILAHGVHLSPDQVRKAADAGCWFVQNPRSNRNNRVGYAAALHVSSQVALGTDGFPADMLDEFDALSACAADYGDDVDRVALRLAASERLLDVLMGPLERSGDCTAGELHHMPLNEWREWADVERRRCTDQLIVEGRTVVEKGRLLTGDIEEIEATARAEAARLWKRMQKS